MSANHKAALRVYSSTLNVEELTALMGTAPDRTIRKGEPISKHPKDSRLHKDSICFYDMETDDPVGLHVCVESLLMLLERSKARLLAESNDLGMDILCYLEVDSARANNSCCFEHDLLQRLAVFPLNVIMNAVPLYFLITPITKPRPQTTCPPAKSPPSPRCPRT
ncbi:hypothetical protein Pan97_17030 [Bremerella volcania]|uniref:DUF4279 domain-containing protein n=1 Tax=Bremerella volcania TaxID=2527984 RepID=A0A518C637_9BACT|nr:hypothetical protein Pan97_17030 [Bremerella volcania]